MATLSVDKFVDIVKRSGLVDNDRLTAILDQVAQESGSHRAWTDDPTAESSPSDSASNAADGEGAEPASETAQLAQRLVDAKLLTRWQCDRLQEGRHKGFILGNKYKLLGLLGTGGMSSVYLAEHVLMQRLRAIKVLPQSRVEDSSYLARFRREAQAANALDHPNIVRVYDIDNDKNVHYIVMEYVEGRDLHGIVKTDGPLSYDLAVEYIRQAAEGLQHAHDANLIHRDIKPANLLVDLKGTVKILDMGLARFTDDENASLTREHDENVLGTADYLAPEQAKDSHTADSRADIYSLGCTFYFLLTGHPPFRDGTLAQRILKHQTQPPPNLYEARPDAPQALVEVCLRMMAKSPNARIQTAGEVARILSVWLAAREKSGSGGETNGFGSPRRVGPPPKPPRRDKSAPVDDTISDRDRATIKGPARGSSAKLQGGGKLVTDVKTSGSPPTGSDAAPPPGGVRRSGNGSRENAAANPDPAKKSNAGNKADATRQGSSKIVKPKSLPVARPIDSDTPPLPDLDPLAPLQDMIGGSAAFEQDPLGRPLAPRQSSQPSSPTVLWYVVGGGVIVVLLLLAFILSR